MSTLEQASSQELEAAVKRARDQLDAHTVEIVQWHFHRRRAARSGWRKQSRAEVRSADRGQGLRRPEEVRPCSRTNGCAAARCGAGCPRRMRTSRSTSSRPAARPAFPRAGSRSRTSASTIRMFSDTLPDEYFPQGRQLADARPFGSAAAAAGRGAPVPSTAAASAFASTSIPAGSSS